MSAGIDPVLRSEQLRSLAKDSWAAFEQGGMEGWAQTWAPDFVLDMTTSGVPGFGAYEGHEAAFGFLHEWVGSFEDWSLELEELHAGAENQTLIVTVQRGRGELSGADVEMRYAQVARWRDGLATRIALYLDIDRARRDAGVPAPD